jgi:hypothetical protein
VRYELCVDTEVEGSLRPDREKTVVAVENPRIYSGDRPTLPKGIKGRELSPQERKIREQQLRALGYVN